MQVKIPARTATIFVALGLFLIAGGSAVAYWLLKPAPTPAQVIYGSGRIEADEVRLGVEVPGRLLENLAVEGEVVLAGDLLARIDPTDYELQADRADAQRGAALQSSAQIDTQIGLASHHERTARTDLGRYETLSREGWITAQRLELVRNAYVTAVDQVGVLRQKRAEAAAQAQVAAKSLALARSQLAKTVVRAPQSGSILERLAEPGEVIAAGQPIAVLANLSIVRLKIFVGERDLGKVKLGASVRIRIDAFPDRFFDARVARVDAQAQFTPRDVHMEDERSRTVYGITVEAANPEGLLKPGMPADAWILWNPRAGWPDRLFAPQ
jgi:HlyD family secretion protein